MRILGHRVRDEHAWAAIAGGSAVVAAFIGRKVLETGWKVVRGEDPPANPESWDVTWRDAIAWTVATGLVIGFSRLLAQRGATAAWNRVTGHMPPI